MSQPAVVSPSLHPQIVPPSAESVRPEPIRTLFVVPELFYLEPLGVMQLSALSEQQGLETRLCVLSRDSIYDTLDDYRYRFGTIIFNGARASGLEATARQGFRLAHYLEWK